MQKKVLKDSFFIGTKINYNNDYDISFSLHFNTLILTFIICIFSIKYLIKGKSTNKAQIELCGTKLENLHVIYHC